MKFFTTFVFLFLFCQTIVGQTSLNGRVVDTNGESLPRINILVYLPGSEVLVAFALSNSDGFFQTEVKSPSDSLIIVVNSMQYRKQSRTIVNQSQELQFEMKPEEQELEGITVRAKAIEQRGDTLSYLVSSFAQEQDRSIEDVLRHMPGIEVEPSGRILYEGMPLQKFMVEGLDLMDGKYAVVSKNLPQGSVAAVEILENHQPIRILEERVSSHQASLNLKLKRDITATGTAKLGVGGTPFLWDANITPMVFTRKFQVLSSWQANNTGNDVADQLRVFTIQDLLKNMDRPSEHPELMKIQDVNPPQIDKNRYLDNNIQLFNFNGLQNISRDYKLRTNIYYVTDQQNRQASLHRSIYNPEDTLVFTEVFDNQFRDKHLQAEFTLNRNVKKNYLNNELKIESRWDSQNGLVATDGQTIHQTLNDPQRAISNDLRSVNAIGKHLIEFQSLLSYDESPHSLYVEPGQFDGALNKGEPYDVVNQQIKLNRFYTNNSAGMVLAWKGMSISPKLGIAYRQQLLQSKISITQGEEENEAGSDFENNLDSRHTRAWMQTNIEYKKRKLTLKAQIPLSWHHVYLRDTDLEKEQQLTRILFDPSLSANYKISNFWRIRALWKMSNRLGDIDRIHYGFILQNYRSLSQNAAALSETSHQSFSSHISYRNPITSFFNSLGYIYAIRSNNLMYSSIIQSDGTTILQTIEQPNTSYVHSLQAETSKFFSLTKTSLSLNFNFNQRMGKSLMNGEAFDTKNIFFTLKPRLNISISTWLNSEYELQADYINTFIESQRKSAIRMIRHRLNFFAFPARNQLISLSSEYYDYEGSDNLFVDLKYRYSIVAKKIDLEVRWNNIFNNKTYTTLQASSFTVYQSTYLLRPSQVLLLVKFSF